VAKQTRGGGFPEASSRQDRDKTKVGELTSIFQTIHGLIDAKDNEPLPVATCANEGEERETGKDCGGVGIYVDSDKLALGDGEGDRCAEIEVGEVGGAKIGILRHHRIQGNVDGRQGGNVCRGRAGGRETVTSRCAADTTTNVVAERARLAGAEKSGRSPLLLYYAVVVGWGRGVSVDGGEGTGALHELDEFVIVAG
jgi:hypothetical protein